MRNSPMYIYDKFRVNQKFRVYSRKSRIHLRNFRVYSRKNIFPYGNELNGPRTFQVFKKIISLLFIIYLTTNKSKITSPLRVSSSSFFR